MYRTAIQLGLFVAVVFSTPGCAWRWYRGDISKLDSPTRKSAESSSPIVSQRPPEAEKSFPVKPGINSHGSPASSDVHAADSPAAAESQPTEYKMSANAETVQRGSPVKAFISDASVAKKFPAKQEAEKKATPESAASPSSPSDKAAPVDNTVPPEAALTDSQAELEKSLAGADSNLPPLVRQQLMGLLEYARQKGGSANDPNAVVLTPQPSDSAATGSPTLPLNASATPNAPSAQISSRNTSRNPNALAAAARNETSTGPAPPNQVPHVTVNVTTSPPPSIEPPARAPDRDIASSGPRDAQTSASREPREIPANASTGPSAPALLPVPAVASNTATRIETGINTAGANVAPASYEERVKEKVPHRPGQWRDNLQQAIDALDMELKTEGAGSTQENKTRLATYLRLLNVAADRREDAVREIESLNKTQKEYWKKQLLALSVALDAEGIPTESRRSALALRHLREATGHLAAESTLDVRNLAFCSKVDGYGVYTEFPKSEFRFDQEVLLYVEVDNFAVEEKSATRKSLQYETELLGTYQILDASGRRVADVDLPLDKQTCRNIRRDYFIAYRLYMPKRIDPGQYTLQLSIEDVKGQKFGQASIDLTIKP